MFTYTLGNKICGHDVGKRKCGAVRGRERVFVENLVGFLVSMRAIRCDSGVGINASARLYTHHHKHAEIDIPKKTHMHSHKHTHKHEHKYLHTYIPKHIQLDPAGWHAGAV